jgi:membrane protease YdiL (CAAX protease family)
MPTRLDLLFVALFAVALPVIDYLVFWPAFRRRSEANPSRARTWLWKQAIVGGWAVVAVGAALWVTNDRSWTSFGFSVPDGWRLWTAIALFLLVVAYQVGAVATLARSSDEGVSVRQQFETFSAVVPCTRTELSWWGGLSLTAGFCEEFLFRGYFLWVFSPWLGWWGAAALSLLFFASGHAYQGWNGVLRTGAMGAFFTVAVAVFGSLWPAIALHTVVDLGGGVMAWVALRESSGTSVQAEPGASPDRGI